MQSVELTNVLHSFKMRGIWQWNLFRMSGEKTLNWLQKVSVFHENHTLKHLVDFLYSFCETSCARACVQFSSDGYIEFRVHQLNLYFSLETANSTVLLRNPNPNELVNWTKSSKPKFIAISSSSVFLFQVKILPIRLKLDWIINFFERTIMTHAKNSNFHRKKKFHGLFKCWMWKQYADDVQIYNQHRSLCDRSFWVYVSMAPDYSVFVVWFWTYNQF